MYVEGYTLILLGGGAYGRKITSLCSIIWLGFGFGLCRFSQSKVNGFSPTIGHE